jgi:hypothetical protein
VITGSPYWCAPITTRSRDASAVEQWSSRFLR